MTHIRLNIVALALALPLAACSGGSGGTDEGLSPDAGSQPEEDTTAPTLLSTAPNDGDIGQLDTVEVVFSFSEAMDQESVEERLDLSEFAPSTMSWNTAGDTLTLSPTSPLAYAEGVDDPEQFVALRYRVTLEEGAVDLAGNALAIAPTMAFSTLKSVAIVIEPSLLLSRVVTPSGFRFTTDDPFVVGDVVGAVTEEGMRSAMSFSLFAIPSTAHSIASATIATRQLLGDSQGTPFTDLGDLVVDHVRYTSDANVAFNSSMVPLSTVGGFFVEDQVVVQVDVSAQVDDDLEHRAEREDLSQFLVRFDTITDLENDNDRVVFSRDLLELSVSYLHP